MLSPNLNAWTAFMTINSCNHLKEGATIVPKEKKMDKNKMKEILIYHLMMGSSSLICKKMIVYHKRME